MAVKVARRRLRATKSLLYTLNSTLLLLTRMTINEPRIIMNKALAGSCWPAGWHSNFTQNPQKTQNLFARSNGLEFTEIANCCALAGLPDVINDDDNDDVD